VEEHGHTDGTMITPYYFITGVVRAQEELVFTIGKAVD